VAATVRSDDAKGVGADQGPRRDEYWFGLGVLMMALGTGSVALLGPLGVGVLRYHASPGAVNQIMGGDVAGLFLATPLALIAGVVALRGHPAGPVLALGPAAYVAYTATQLALGGDVVRYAGNSERFFLLFLALFVLAGILLVRAWSVVDAAHLPPLSRRFTRFFTVFALVIAGFLVLGLHLPGLVGSLTGGPGWSSGLPDPTVFWLVKFMDLGVVVPVLVGFAVGLLQGRRWAHKAAYAVVGWIALLGSAVAGMAIVMQVRGDPEGTLANVAAFGSFAAIGIVAAIIAYRPLWHLADRRPPPRRPMRPHS